MLETLMLRETAPTAGKLIREVQGRPRSGAPIVGIERAATSIVNPGPDEELPIGDVLYLLGNAEQLSRVRRLLEGEASLGARLQDD